MDARMHEEDAGYIKRTLTSIRYHRDHGGSWPKSVWSAIELRSHTAWTLDSLAAVVQRTANRLDEDVPADRAQNARDMDVLYAEIAAGQRRRGHVEVLQGWQDKGWDRALIEHAAKLLEVEAPVAS